MDTAPTLGAGAGLEDQPAGAHRRAEPGAAVLPGHLDRAGSRQNLPFTAVVIVLDTEYGTGVGRSKKEAEQKAAAAAWKALETV